MSNFRSLLKGQSDVISAVLILVIAIGLVGTAYVWGIPLIQKRQDSAYSDRVDSYFDQSGMSIVGKISTIAANGGEDTFTSDVSGIWTLNPCVDAVDTSCAQQPYYNFENNSLEFSFFSTVSQYGVGQGWITLSSTDPCPSPSANVGQNPYVVCVRSDTNGNGYNVTFKVQFRELDTSDDTQGFKIVLIPTIPNLNTSTANSIKISRGNVFSTIDSSGKTLIVTEVNILLG